MNRRQLRADCTLERLASERNLLLAADKARKRKSRRPDVEAWWLRREQEINRLREELLAQTWRPTGYRFFTIHEPKRRLIAAAPFADRVVHHALCNVMQPLLERRLIARSFSCQIGNGTTTAREKMRWLVKRSQARLCLGMIPADMSGMVWFWFLSSGDHAANCEIGWLEAAAERQPISHAPPDR